MPRVGDIYEQPFPDVAPATTIESTVYNGFTHDVETDLNAARPIVAGGTGATNAEQARFNLQAEVAAQVVTNYDSHMWLPGSFRSAVGATGAPNSTSDFAGVCYIGEALAYPPTNENVVVEARDLGDASVPGLVYVREKLAGVWSAWVAEITDADITAKAVRYDVAQSLTDTQKKQARSNIGVPDGNVIINGDFRVNQVGYVSASVLAAGAYGHDQWKAGDSGGDYSFTQLKSSTQITIATGKSLIQPIEDANVVGGSYVLTWTGTAQARAGVNTLTPAGAYAASPLLIAGQTAGTVMSIEFNNGTLGTVKLESGSIATPFIMRPVDQELLMCLRYYYKRFAEIIGNASATGQDVGAWFPHQVVMRAEPAVVVTGGSLINCTGGGVSNITTTGFRTWVQASAAGSLYYTGFQNTADARL